MWLGSGKTIVALHRALYLQLNYCFNEDDAVLLLTYNKALINYLNYIFKKIVKEHEHEYSNLYSKANRKVDKLNIDKMIRDHYVAIAGEDKLEFVYYNEAIRSILKECISEVKKDYHDVPFHH